MNPSSPGLEAPPTAYRHPGARAPSRIRAGSPRKRAIGRRPGLIPRLLATVGILLYAVAVPLLEANASHLLNPAWAPHARIHEAWQLTTNASLGALAAWRLWRHQDLRSASAINGLVMGSFLVVYGLRGLYGGSMAVEGRGEFTVLGLNIALVGFSAALLCNGAALLAHPRASRVRRPPFCPRA